MEQTNTLFIVIISLATVFLLFIVLLFVLIYSQKNIRAKQQQMYQAIISTQISEQQRIGVELHDQVCTNITGILSALELVSTLPETTKAHENQLQKGLKPLRIINDRIRRISHNLEQISLRKNGLKSAIDDFCNIMETPHLEIKLHQNHDFENLPSMFQHQLINTIQELIHNAKKHSQGNLIEVKLIQLKKTGVISVKDNGVGYTEGNSDGMGLQNIKNRVNLFRGKFMIVNHNDGGALFEITFPLNAII